MFLRVDAKDKGWHAPALLVYLRELFAGCSPFLLFGPAPLHGFGDAPATFRCEVALLSNNSFTRPANAKLPVGCSIEHGARLLQLGNLAINLR
jgi:hypothetical protein